MSHLKHIKTLLDDPFDPPVKMRFAGVLTLNYLNSAEIMYVMKHFITAHHFEFLKCFDNAFNQDYQIEDLFRGVSEEFI